MSRKSIAPDAPEERLLAAKGTYSVAQSWSSDGKHLIYSACGPQLDGGGDPRWSRSGRELFYVANDRRLMAVDVKTRGRLAHGSPVALFDTGMPPQWYEARNLYDVSRDGRFLFMSPVEADRSSPFTMIVSPTALKRPSR